MKETKQIKVTKTVVYDVDSIKWKIQWGKPAGYIVSFDEVVEHLTDYMIEDVKRTNDGRPTRFLEDRGFYELHDDEGRRIPKRQDLTRVQQIWYNRTITTKKGSR